MRIFVTFTLVCLGLAILGTFVLESKLFRNVNEKVAFAGVWFVLMCCYGVCVGAISSALTYFFHFGGWIAFIISVLLGIPLLLLAAKAGEL